MDAARTRGYLLYLRGGLWRAQGRPDLALADYRESLVLDPGRPNTLNNFAWLVATREVPGREGLAEHALSAAAKALEATGLAAHRDTLACALALTGRFGEAAAEERRALSGRTGKAAMRARLAGFLASPPRDCTGAE